MGAPAFDEQPQQQIQQTIYDSYRNEEARRDYWRKKKWRERQEVKQDDGFAIAGIKAPEGTLEVLGFILVAVVAGSIFFKPVRAGLKRLLSGDE